MTEPSRARNELPPASGSRCGAFCGTRIRESVAGTSKGVVVPQIKKEGSVGDEGEQGARQHQVASIGITHQSV